MERNLFPDGAAFPRNHHVTHGESDTHSRSSILQRHHIHSTLHATPGARGWCRVSDAFRVLIDFFLNFTQTMYQGVLRDDARRLDKHRQRDEALQESLRKRELYERVQTVSNPAPLSPSSPLTEEEGR